MKKHTSTTDQKLAQLVATIIQAARNQKRAVPARTYRPGPRQLKNYKTSRVIREVHRRSIESHGTLSDADKALLAAELQRRNLSTSAAIVTGAGVATMLSPLLEQLTHQGLHESQASVDEAASDFLVAESDQDMIEPFTSADLLEDMRDQQLDPAAIEQFDMVADFMVTDLGAAIEQQNAVEQPVQSIDLEAVAEVPSEAAEL